MRAVLVWGGLGAESSVRSLSMLFGTCIVEPVGLTRCAGRWRTAAVQHGSSLAGGRSGCAHAADVLRPCVVLSDGRPMIRPSCRAPVRCRSVVAEPHAQLRHAQWRALTRPLFARRGPWSLRAQTCSTTEHSRRCVLRHAHGLSGPDGYRKSDMPESSSTNSTDQKRETQEHDTAHLRSNTRTHELHIPCFRVSGIIPESQLVFM